MNEIYVDNNATTAVDPLVLEAMLPFLKEHYGNPSSMHSFGGNVAHHIKKAREQVAHILGVQRADEIIFTSCGTESNNTAIRVAMECSPKKRQFITSYVEHPAVKSVYESLEEKGYKIEFITVDRKGRLDLDELKTKLSNETALVSIMYANNETGVIFPIEEIGTLVKACGALFHTDAVQAVGKIPLSLQNSTVDMLSLSGHKLHAPKGVGALYVRTGIPYRPFMIGGASRVWPTRGD